MPPIWREYIFRHLIGPDSILKGYSIHLYIALNKYVFSLILARLNQLQCSATLIYGITVHDLGKVQNTSPAGLLVEESNIYVF